jgi:predicted amidophosphoribosyltransferase
MVRDSVGLTSGDRERNLSGRIKLRRAVTGDILLVDDIVTTGATAREAVRTLAKSGAKVTAVLTLAQA